MPGLAAGAFYCRRLSLAGLKRCHRPSLRSPPKIRRLPVIDGIRLATAEAGIRYKGRSDVLLALFDEGTTVAGRVHQVEMPARAGRVVPRQDQARQGARARRQFRQRQRIHGPYRPPVDHDDGSISGEGGGFKPAEVYLASTGVIGEPLDATKFEVVMADAGEQASPDRWLDAARAIMTTDTFPKIATATVKLGKADVTINGMAKGAGMIMPDMATMLSFVFTDAPISAPYCVPC